MKLTDKPGWDLTVKNNQDPYGKATVDFARTWAELMETEIAKGHSVAEIAKDASLNADTEGISGFMYGYAVSILSQVWEYGEELRVWHNLDVQLGNEGERANIERNVLNPALLMIGKS